MNFLKQAQNIVKACDRCGTCLTVCPLFTLNGIERTSARGKNSIIRAFAAGLIPEMKEAQRALDYCLLCRACVDICPAHIQTDEAVIFLRHYLASNSGGPPLRHRLMGKILKNRPVMRVMGHFFSLWRAGKNNLLRRKYLTALAGPALLGRKTLPSTVTPRHTDKVAFFEGCGMKFIFPAVAEKTKRLLQATTGNFLTPENMCCGLPHLAHGLIEDFIKLAQRNMELFSSADIIVTDCASCGSTLKHLARFVPGEEAKNFADRVMDITEYLVKVGYVPRKRGNLPLTYHDPCHLARGQGITKEPRALLKQVGDFREMAGANECCGGAGSFCFEYPKAAKLILERKERNIAQTGAEVVVTACPGCLIQLSRLSISACHISEII